ncbi:carboxymuconolactone decarboxylase family protein [Blastococcus sp. SYSU D01042]
MTPTAPEHTLHRVAAGDSPVLDTVFDMHVDSLERSGLDPRTYVLVRLAALVALDGPPVSYAVTLAAAEEAGVTVEEAQSVLVALAPLVGTAQIMSAAGGIVRAFVGAAALTEGGVAELRAR